MDYMTESELITKVLLELKGDLVDYELDEGTSIAEAQVYGGIAVLAEEWLELLPFGLEKMDAMVKLANAREAAFEAVTENF